MWNGAVDDHPAVIAHCRGTDDVVAAVTLAAAARVPLAVRAGGHSVAGFSSCDGGVVVDLAPMRGVAVDPHRRRAVVQPGATWADFDAATGHTRTGQHRRPGVVDRGRRADPGGWHRMVAASVRAGL